MDGKIAVEETFGASDPNIVVQSEQHFRPQAWPAYRARLLDMEDERLRLMDEAGIEIAVLSLLSPGIQALHDRAQAVDWARRLNDHVAEQVAKHPDRFTAFAALPLQDPDAAIAELRRGVRELGFRGALVNGFSQVDSADSAHYYDEPRYRPFWEHVQQLDVPVYLHPRDPLSSRAAIYDGHPWLLGSAWGFSVETGTHALRLMGSGLFDAYPRLQIILGHLGELLPFNIWRTDHRISVSPRGIPAKRKFADYLRDNFHVTISGNYRTPTLINTILEVGADRVLFATDHPFEDMVESARWFDGLELGRGQIEQIGRSNAACLLKIDLPDAA